MNQTPGTGSSGITVSTFVFSGLTRMSVDASTASKYATFAQDLSSHIANNPTLQRAILMWNRGVLAWNISQIQQGYGTAVRASTLMSNANDLGLSGAGFERVADGGLATMLSASVVVIDAIAKKNGVTLNQCALSISKLSLDFAGTLAAGGATVATAPTGVGAAVGAVLTVMQIYAVGTDAYSLGVYCIDPAIAYYGAN
jgi:hypothetical protein